MNIYMDSTDTKVTQAKGRGNPTVTIVAPCFAPQLPHANCWGIIHTTMVNWQTCLHTSREGNSVSELKNSEIVHQINTRRWLTFSRPPLSLSIKKTFVSWQHQPPPTLVWFSASYMCICSFFSLLNINRRFFNVSNIKLACKKKAISN